MRTPQLALLALSLAACSSSEVTTTITSSSSTPAKSSTKSAAPPPSASAASSASAAGSAAAGAARDGEEELKRIAPFDAAVTDTGELQKRVLAGYEVCGGAPSATPWGKDLPPGPPTSRCTAANHAKLFMLDGGLLDSKKEAAEANLYLGLALDPGAALPPKTSPLAADALAAAKKRPAPGVRLGAVSTSDDASKADLEKAAAGEISAAVRFCYASALLTNPKAEGNVAIEAMVAADGRLSGSKASGSLDATVNTCITELANRSKVNAPTKAPAKVNIPFVCAPGSK